MCKKRATNNIERQGDATEALRIRFVETPFKLLNIKSKFAQYHRSVNDLWFLGSVSQAATNIGDTMIWGNPAQ